MENDKAKRAAQSGIDALRQDGNINAAFRACLPDVFRSRAIAEDIQTFEDCGLRITEVPGPGLSHVAGIPLMTGELGAVIDKVNQKLQVLMAVVDGDDKAETCIAEIAELLRAHYRATIAPGRYIAIGETVKLGSEVAGRMRSHSMAKRTARALNLQNHKI